MPRDGCPRCARPGGADWPWDVVGRSGGSLWLVLVGRETDAGKVLPAGQASATGAGSRGQRDRAGGPNYGSQPDAMVQDGRGSDRAKPSVPARMGRGPARRTEAGALAPKLRAADLEGRGQTVAHGRRVPSSRRPMLTGEPNVGCREPA